MRRWATGVLIYEMVAGTPPFSDEDRVTMFKNICHVRYNMPAYFSKVPMFPARTRVAAVPIYDRVQDFDAKHFVSCWGVFPDG